MISNVVGMVSVMMLLLAGVTDVGLIAGIVDARVKVRSIRAAYGGSLEGRTATHIGVDIHGGLVDLTAHRLGTAVWYASKDCPYCKRDQEWTTLAAALQAKGVRIVFLSPSYEQRFAPEQMHLSNVLEVPFVGPEWLAQFPLIVTPTLLLFDGEGHMVWYKRGMLSKGDSRNAMTIADSISGHVTRRVGR